MSKELPPDAIRFCGGALRLDLLYNPAGQQRGGVLALLLASPHRDHPAARGALRALRGQSFNTSALFSGFALGPLFHAIGDAGLEEKDGAEQARRTALVLAPALAALGDRFVFGGVQPVWSALVIAAAVLLPEAWLPWVFAAALAMHAALHAYWRCRGWGTGLEREGAVLAFLRSRVLERWIASHRQIVHFASGAAVGGSAMFAVRQGDLAHALVLLGGFASIVLWSRRRTAGRGRAGVLLLWAAVWAWLVP